MGCLVFAGLLGLYNMGIGIEQWSCISNTISFDVSKKLYTITTSKATITR